MNWKLRVLVPALLIAPQAAWALGLGDIRLDSALNQPLSAEIDLVSATPEELSSLQARLASRELFQRYGIDRANYLDSLQFKVGRGKDGRDVLLVRTTTPMAEPFLTFLVEVTWGQGRLLREYTVLLDPPVFEPVEKAAPAPVAAPRNGRRYALQGPDLPEAPPRHSVEEFRDYYQNHHRPLVEKYSAGISRYVRRYHEPLPHLDTKEMSEPEFDVVTELWCANREVFDGLLSMVKFGTLPPEVIEDEERIFNRPKTSYVYLTECEG